MSAFLARARVRWHLLIWVAALGWLDLVVHHDAVTPLLVLGLGALILFADELRARLGGSGQSEKLWRKVPRLGRQFLMAAPFLAYYFLRGQGAATGAAILGLLTTIVMILALSATAKVVDESVIGFYRARDRVPRWVRIVSLQAAAVLIGFGIVHGSLDDLPSLVGGPSLHPGEADTVQLRVAIAAVLSTTTAWLLFHRPEP